MNDDDFLALFLQFLAASDTSEFFDAASVALRAVTALEMESGFWPNFHGAPPGYHLRYILDENGDPVPANDDMEVHRLLCNIKKRRVALTIFEWRGYHFEVSTVFLVHNRSHSMKGPPVLWGTTIFTNYPPLDEVQRRYISRDCAMHSHYALVKEVRAYLRVRRPWPSPRRKRVAERRIKAGQSVLRRRPL